MKNCLNKLFGCLLSIFVVTPVCAASSNQLLVGKWQCNTSFTDMYEVNVTSLHTFKKGGSFSSSADVELAMPKSAISVGYHLVAKGDWQVKNGVLIFQGRMTSVENTLHPEWDQMLNLKQLIPDTLKGKATIKHLDNTSLVLNDSHTGRNYSCMKI
ncbi:hypothetical protein [Vibrio salinus]|uniref:hypothetical protein n=1 Tax=Vibrio salinus TaxID=2899784 RepID=UPI001E4C23C8|nr:hypothetical protein [Vibrio salinus]MCE0495370.1 hypothetical protein [Vibrio salinus]